MLEWEASNCSEQGYYKISASAFQQKWIPLGQMTASKHLATAERPVNASCPYFFETSLPNELAQRKQRHIKLEKMVEGQVVLTSIITLER